MSVCIGSDDPLTFATTLPHEYQLLFDAIVRSDESHEVALNWLDEARKTGMRARFTLPRSITRRPTESDAQPAARARHSADSAAMTVKNANEWDWTAWAKRVAERLCACGYFYDPDFSSEC